MTATVLTRLNLGRRVVWGAVAVGGLGLLATLLGGVAAPREAAYGYLFAFAFWLTLSLGALIILASFHASRARWPPCCGGRWRSWPRAARCSCCCSSPWS